MEIDRYEIDNILMHAGHTLLLKETEDGVELKCSSCPGAYPLLRFPMREWRVLLNVHLSCTTTVKALTEDRAQTVAENDADSWYFNSGGGDIEDVEVDGITVDDVEEIG